MSATPIAVPVQVVWTVTASGQSASVTPATPLQVSVAQVHLGLKGATGDMHPGIPLMVQQAADAAEAAATSADRVDLGALDQAVEDAEAAANEAGLARSGAVDAKLAAETAAADAANKVSKAGDETIAGVKTFEESPLLPPGGSGAQPLQAQESMKRLGTGAALPDANIGPIWHEDYADIMTWRTIGAYTGYASVRLGEVSYFDVQSAPAGWLKSVGQTLTETYAALNEYRGSATLRDLRGEFVRGWDDGRGVDTGRVFGSEQSSSNLAHTHNVTNSGTSSSASGSNRWIGGTASGSTTITSASSGGTEARPRNVALLACIKF